jgi:RNA polymerase sigma-70 factor (ECF subfamily)
VKASGTEDPYDKLIGNERLRLVHRLINELPERQRLMVQLRDIEGKNYKEIATALGLTEDQVKVNLFRARQKIKEQYLQIDEYGL